MSLYDLYLNYDLNFLLSNNRPDYDNWIFLIGSSADGSCKSCSSICGLGDTDSVTSGPVTFSGTRLSLPESGTSLTIPEGALPKGFKEQVYLAVLREDRHRPKLRGLWTFTSDSISDSSF